MIKLAARRVVVWKKGDADRNVITVRVPNGINLVLKVGISWVCAGDDLYPEVQTTGRWRSHRTWTLDGASFSMPDTPELQDHFGQPLSQAKDAVFEVNFRHLKTTMRLEVLHCQTVAGVLKELYMFAITYNLVRLAMLEASRRKNVLLDRVKKNKGDNKRVQPRFFGENDAKMFRESSRFSKRSIDRSLSQAPPYQECGKGEMTRMLGRETRTGMNG
jgi:hypothetical protein